MLCIPLIALTSLHAPLASAQWTITYTVDQAQATAALGAPRVPKMLEAVERVKKSLEKILANSIGNVQLTINLAPPTSPTALAEAASSQNHIAALSVARNKLMTQATADSESLSEEQLYEALPTNQVPFRFDTDTLRNATFVAIPNSLNKHLNFAPTTNQNDGTITFRPPTPSQSIDWQFWRRTNRTLADKQSFEGVLIHETFHALGFTTFAENPSTPIVISSWDLFRFADTDIPINAANFTTTQREFRPTVEATGITALSNGAQSYKLSRGTRTGGDANQASHWRSFSRLTPQTPIGIMDPQGGGSAREDLGGNFYTQADARALDVMGWNIEPTQLNFAPPPPVDLVSPPNLALIVHRAPITFSWTGSGHNDYNVYIGRGTQWDELNAAYSFDHLPADTSSVVLTSANALPPGEYVWYVIGTTDLGFGGSDDRRFTIVAGVTPCGPADLGQQGGALGSDGLLDSNDFVAFNNFFFASDPRADLGSQGGVVGSDGQLDSNDFVAFIGLFFAGCP